MRLRLKGVCVQLICLILMLWVRGIYWFWIILPHRGTVLNRASRWGCGDLEV